jgi:hypothetical protein
MKRIPRLFLNRNLLAVTGYLFQMGVLTALTQTIEWSIVFFIASAAASSAYLTVSEIFPLEIRGLAIAVSFTHSAHWRAQLRRPYLEPSLVPGHALRCPGHIVSPES